MAYKIKAKVEGLESVLAALALVDRKVRKKAIRKSVNEARKIITRAAKRLVRKKTGLLRKSIGGKVKVYKGTDTAVAIVGPRVGFRKEVVRDGRAVLSNPTKYAHLVELGTRHSAPFPFLGPALRQTQAQVKLAMAAVIRAAVEGAT